MPRSKDDRTFELFSSSGDQDRPPGSLQCRVEIAHTMSEALKRRSYDRFEVASRMSRLLGEEVSKAMLDAYTAESRERHNISLERAIAFDAATESYALMQLAAEKLGGTFLGGEDLVLVELAKLEHQEHELKIKGNELKARKQQLKSLLGMRK